MRNISKIGPESWTITIEKHVQFQVAIWPTMKKLYHIQNGQPAATFDCNMRDNWKTLPDS